MKPETRKILPLLTAFEQLAQWLGSSKEEIEKLFDLPEILRIFTRTPAYLVITDIEERGPDKAARCEFINQDNWYICAKIIGRISEKIAAKHTNPRL